MGDQVDMKFTWVVKNVSSLQSEKRYSDLFVIGGCSWRVVAYSNGNKFSDSLSLSLALAVADAEYLPFGWRRHAEFSFTIVNQISEEFSQVQDIFRDLTETQECFDHKNTTCGCAFSFPLGKLEAKYGGCVMNEQVKIVAEVKVLEAIGKSGVSKEANQPLKRTKLNEVTQKKDRHEERNPAKRDKEERHDRRENRERHEKRRTRVSEEANQPLKRMKLEDHNAAASIDLLVDTPQVEKETITIDINGFTVFPSELELFCRIFKKQPDFASDYIAKSAHPSMKRIVIDALVFVINTLDKPLQEISRSSLGLARHCLKYTISCGLKVGWLEKKLNEVTQKKEKEEK